MTDNVYVSNFRSIKPPYCRKQDETVQWLAEQHKAKSLDALPKIIDKKFRYYSVKESKISNRYVASFDMTHLDFDTQEIFSPLRYGNQKYKSDFFKKYTEGVFKELYATKESLPDHLIHVTCTGYISPSAGQVVVSQFAKDTKVTHAYHMGCYAAIPALRMARAFAQCEDRECIDIVHTETCSIHMNPTVQTPEQIVIQTLFADGNIAYTVSKQPKHDSYFELIAQQEMIVPGTTEDMCWNPQAWGFEMTLSRDVPSKIAGSIGVFLERLAHKNSISLKELVEKSIFAVHPGGPKIIDSIQDILHLRDEQVAFSKTILFERGNMSSATLPHVWERILQEHPKDGTHIVSLAFGPGLTIFGSIFRTRVSKCMT